MIIFKSLFSQRIACHVQLFALTRWLTINLPIEYYEFTRGVEWIIPHHKLPWESSTGDSLKGYSAFPASAYSQLVESSKMTSLPPLYESSLEGKPLTPMEYRSIFEVKSNFIYLVNLLFITLCIIICSNVDFF